MGIGNFFKNATNKTTELIQNGVDRQNELRQLHSEQRNMPQSALYIRNGSQLIHCGMQATMYQRNDGTVYFNNNTNDSFSLVGYDWNGPVYDTIQNSVSNTNGTEVTKGKMGKMTTGAVIGSFIMPGIGTAVGAAIGASGKKKKQMQSTTQTNSIQHQSEVPTPATLTFINNHTGERFGVVIACNSLIDSQIKCFNFTSENTPYISQQLEQEPLAITQNTSADSYEELKKAKELLDMGILTQEEFEAKKRQLLNL